jgi:hypothetical protein
MVPGEINMDLGQVFNFAHRQYLLTRVYWPRLYFAALGLTSLWLLGFVTAWGYLLLSLTAGAPWTVWGVPAAAMVIVAACNGMRSALRQQVIAETLGPEVLAKLKQTMQFDRWATPLWMALHWVLILRAGFGRTMTWRGIRYRLAAPQQVQRL